ncbi:zf-RING_2 domain-containing protein [Cephalotus follicularis]|uniref:RING-type E3 ubiquitin transferase n=1 Tax=Cephalotus follicularis TaxID=3775 RepID=A0A1Q3CWZ8_CEPFO|nr:zf-RING_2 domain-containing protein [Cephalotus follicularis]
MANIFTCPASFENSLLMKSSASSSSSGAAAATAAVVVDDSFEEDACSICLEPFSTQDPATVTSCKHEYHLQCILEWSQRSKECPICWQLLILKDPASQELLAAVESERRSRSKNLTPIGSLSFRHFHENFEVEVLEEEAAYSDDSDFDERIMQHLAVAASRARYVRRRERQRSSGRVPSDVLFTSPSNVPGAAQARSTSPEDCQSLSYESSDADSPTSGIPFAVNVQYSSSVVPLVGNVVCTAVNKDGSDKPRALYTEPASDSPQKSGTSEMNFPESVKSKWSVASTRFKESFSKGTRGLKEKLLAHNNSVKELSKGVQREMNTGIAGVARMIDRLDISSKRTVASVPVSACTRGTSNFAFKGKGVEENFIVHTLNKTDGEFAHNLSSDAPAVNSGTIPGRVEVFHAE